MKKIIHRAYQRKIEDLGWIRIATSLKPELSAAEQRHFGCLVRLDDTMLQPGARGFGMHSHNNVEIISIVIKGQLLHEDSVGHRAICQAGDIQVTSAGSGIMHNESNASEHDGVEVLQIRILPSKKNLMPSYQNLASQDIPRNQCQLLIAPNTKQKKVLQINQDAYFYRGHFDAHFSYRYHLKKSVNGVYFFILSGKLKVGDEVLERRDGLGLYFFQEVDVLALEKSEVLVIEIPMNHQFI
ncbi:pirin family protein [Candidatus Albibeggiatoa sp. nov. NOAA]|uniref:pirin family protein n=1 Tax=Candidatus Albibeggiatoa sp. nov. NOAA TaxID=3162724 RepID=UPI0032F66E1C|nr:pirin family protein [Thiotrichaceae bacterium]